MERTLTYCLYLFIAILLACTLVLLPKTPSAYKTRNINKNPNQANTVMAQLSDQTIHWGIFKPHMQSSEKLAGINESFGAGACVLDYDNDGWLDLFLINGSGQRHFFGAKEWWQSNRAFTLYKNTGLNSFTDVTDQALDKNLDAWGIGCTASDLDNDGDQDLLISNFGPNLLLENNGKGQFNDVSKKAGLTGDNWSTSALTADFNNDGLLDVYLLNYIKYQQGQKTYEASSGYDPQNTVQFNPSLFDSSPNQLFINQGNLTFIDQSESANVQDISGRGLSAVAIDINADKYLDIFIANGEGSPNKLYINNKNLSFSDVSERYKISSIQQSTGSAFGDISNNGNMDLFIGTDNKNSKILYQNEQNGVLTDIIKQSGLDKTETSGAMTWGTSIVDLNNDGLSDIFLANGFTNPDLIAPRKAQGQPNVVLLNNGNKFTQCDNTCYQDNTYENRDSSRSVIPFDADNDGDLDLYISQNNTLGQLLINTSPNKNWLGIKLQGKVSNTDALNTKIILKTTDNSYTKITNNSGFLSSSDKRLVFNFGI